MKHAWEFILAPDVIASPCNFYLLSHIVKLVNEGFYENGGDEIDEAIELLLYCMKTQIFIDGNKRASVIFANHFMVQHGLGLVVVPESIVAEFKLLLVAYYEDRDQGEIKQFLKEKCWRKF